jgi:dCMP deaminase
METTGFNKYNGLYKEVDIPSWDKYFMDMAIFISKRSPDSQTQHGSIIVDINKHIIGTGYNAPAKGLDITKLPNVRPQKYPFFIHSEINAIINMTLSPSNFNWLKIYVTGVPCIPCLSALINSNIKEIVYNPSRGWSFTDEFKEDFDFLIEQSGIKLIQYNDT